MGVLKYYKNSSLLFISFIATHCFKHLLQVIPLINLHVLKVRFFLKVEKNWQRRRFMILLLHKWYKINAGSLLQWKWLKGWSSGCKQCTTLALYFYWIFLCEIGSGCSFTKCIQSRPWTVIYWQIYTSVHSWEGWLSSLQDLYLFCQTQLLLLGLTARGAKDNLPLINLFFCFSMNNRKSSTTVFTFPPAPVQHMTLVLNLIRISLHPSGSMPSVAVTMVCIKQEVAITP